MGTIKIGWGVSNITPPKPVELAGQLFERVTDNVRDPLLATAMALESSGKEGGQAVLVSCDLVAIEKHIQLGVREKIKETLPDLHPECVILNATHTHTGPKTLSITQFFPPIGNRQDYTDMMSPEEYSAFCIDKIAEAVKDAWQKRKPGTLSREEGYAALSHNRRVLYDDETVKMYGSVDSIHFRGFDGPEDHRVELLFTWDENQKLTGVLVNAACTAQIIEQEWRISADYFSELRELVKQRWGSDVFVLGMIGAAGDLAPRDLIRLKQGGEFGGEEALRTAASNLLRTIEGAYDSARQQMDVSPIFKHSFKTIQLPLRRVAKHEAERAASEWEAFLDHYEQQEDPVAYFDGLPFDDKRAIFDNWGVQNRYRQLREDPFFLMELHALRIGDAVIVTNPFELFTEYGLIIKARSTAKQTFIAQHACDSGGYLPTTRAIATGGYSTQVFSGVTGDEGGRLLVEHTLQAIEALWDE